MYCNYCGKVIQDDANVCAYCGRRVGAVVARRKLVRPRPGRKVAGVCLGFAEYFDLDVTLIRVMWLLAAILVFPVGEIAYLIAWIVMPDEPLAASIVRTGDSAVSRPTGDSAVSRPTGDSAASRPA